MYITHKSANFIRNAFNKIHFVLIADAGQICVHIPASLTSLGLSSWRYRHIEAVAVVVSPADRTRISCNRDMTCCDTVAVLGWGQGGTGPPNLAQAPKFLIGSRLYWGYIGVRGYTPYTNLWCFWRHIIISFDLICHNKTGYTGIYDLTVNKRMCTAPCHTKLLNFFPCTFCLTCNAYSWEALLAYK